MTQSKVLEVASDLVNDIAVGPERPVGAEVVLLALGGVLLRDAVPPVLVHGVQVQLDGWRDSEFTFEEFEFRQS